MFPLPATTRISARTALASARMQGYSLVFLISPSSGRSSGAGICQPAVRMTRIFHRRRFATTHSMARSSRCSSLPSYGTTKYVAPGASPI